MKKILFTCVMFLLMIMTAFAQTNTDIAALKAKAQAGDVKAQCQLGVYFLEKDGKDFTKAKEKDGQNLKQAKFWLVKAAKTGDAESQYQLGMYYMNMTFRVSGKNDYKADSYRAKSYELWYSSAQKGWPQAQRIVGEHLYFDNPEMRYIAKLPKYSRIEGLRYLFLAAKQGDETAIKAFQDYANVTKATISMFEDMARLGYPLFQKRVADYYLKEKNYDMAVPWYKKLVEAKDSVTSTYALYRLIDIYTDSPTVKDPVQAANCYVKLADRTSFLLFFYSAAELYYETGMYNEAVKYFTMARNSSIKIVSASACFYLSKLYYNGRGCEQDEVKATALRKEAAEKGCKDAQDVLRYENEESLPL